MVFYSRIQSTYFYKLVVVTVLSVRVASVNTWYIWDGTCG